ncbi:MAG: lipid-A-disaccharide synthase [Deltaproteobacteria bacterium]|jgi:lipid-A-disaccharide synthase|nr:lipid-A-disaccharide synthase [Deltaproteobacteria bacterium]
MGAVIEIMLCAGEESGDIHAAALVRAARAQCLPWRFRGLGGDHLEDAGASLDARLEDVAVMGLGGVLRKLPRILKVFRALRETIRARRPAALILIDSPDFNMRLAKYATRLGVPVIYYICPQVWAWRAGRLKALERWTSRRALIFPFEKEFYAKRGVSADLVGHPLLDELAESGPFPDPPQIRASLGLAPDKPVVALLPGSRPGVFRRLAPIFLEAAGRVSASRPEIRFAIPRAKSLPASALAQELARIPPALREKITVLEGESRPLLKVAAAALLASGSAALEAAVLGAPAVVAYRAGFLSWSLAKRLVRLPFVSVPNLIFGRALMPEFLQEEARPASLAASLISLLEEPLRRETLAGLAEVRAYLGGPGASNAVLSLAQEEIAKGEARAEGNLRG